ncbi:MAG TPA: MAPEG family protein [Hyphomonadaceae bacterium]|nr:MAPEG family protein [Hyphomonadaceae bacterium]
MPDLGSTQLTMLWLSIILGIVHVAIAATGSVAKRGLPWAAGPRDDPPAPPSKVGGRLERASQNFLETFPFFAVAVLVEMASNGNPGLAGIGAMTYFWARVAYLPIYALGLPFIRTLVWTVSVVGIGIVLAACIPGV